jgi:hypothetical protein
MTLHFWFLFQHRDILERHLPDSLKMSIAKRIENNLYSKVVHGMLKQPPPVKPDIIWQQVPFLSTMHGVGNIRTLFSAEVCLSENCVLL